MTKLLFGGRWSAALTALLALVAVPLLAPQVLAFPYRAEVGGHVVRAEMPITPELVAAVARADELVAAGPLAHARASDQPVFLTKGGWRWRWLALSAGDALGVSRQLVENAVINRTDPVAATVHNGLTQGHDRPLAEVLAHEFTHGSVRSHFGLVRSFLAPQQLVEGFGDYVAGGSTLTDEEATRLLATGEHHPALPYWQGRKRIEREMARPGMTVDRLFAEWGATAGE